MNLTRRSLLAGATGLAGLAAGCANDDAPSRARPSPSRPAGTREEPDVPPPDDAPATGTVERIDYGPDAESQFLELRRPDLPPKGVVVVLHGGFWRSRYDLSLGRPLADALAVAGWAACTVEYRRVGNGGGYPQTFDDVAAAIDALADVEGLDTSTVLTLGHSAGGHLAVWAAARGRLAPWRPVRVPVGGAVSQAGVLDLVAAHESGLGGGAVAAFLDGLPVEDWGLVDPAQQVPLPVPVRCVHGSADDIVPPAQSEAYVAAATAAGADASLHVVGGDHFTVIDPGSAAWRLQLGLLEGLRG